MLVILGVGSTSVDYFYFTKCIVIVLFLHWNTQFLTWLSVIFLITLKILDFVSKYMESSVFFWRVMVLKWSKLLIEAQWKGLRDSTERNRVLDVAASFSQDFTF